MGTSDEIREVALTLAQDNLDDDAAEEAVSQAMWLIKETVAREELSGPLGLEVGKFLFVLRVATSLASKAEPCCLLRLENREAFGRDMDDQWPCSVMMAQYMHVGDLGGALGVVFGTHDVLYLALAFDKNEEAESCMQGKIYGHPS